MHRCSDIQGGDRRRHRQWRLDLDRLSDRRDHRHSAYRLSQPRCSRSAAICWSTRCCSWCSRWPVPLRTTWQQMIVLRAMQGFTGGVLIPHGVHHHPDHAAEGEAADRPGDVRDIATFAPAIGPTIGGYLTETYGWQYIFYRQSGSRRGHAGDPVAVAASARRCSLACSSDGDWTGIAAHGDRPRARCRPCWRRATRTTGSDSPFIVRLSVVAAVCSVAVHLDRADDGRSRPSICGCLVRRNFGFGTLSQRHRSASRSTARSIMLPQLSVADVRATTPSRSARCWPGPACRSF